MKQLLFKIVNAGFISGTFVYYMVQERYPLLVIQSLTYQGLLLLALYTEAALLESFIPSLKRVTNVLQHISFPVAILISLLSWGLGIPVDYRGLATYKNHFFHSLNTLSCAAAMLVLDQDWRSGSLVLPFRYGLAYALSQFVLQRLGQPVLYPFLDFSAAPGLAVGVVLGCAALLPLIHTALCHAADTIQARRDRARGHD